MNKLKALLKGLLVITAGIVFLIYLDNQNPEIRMLFGIFGLILYLAYLVDKRIDQLTEQITKDKRYQCIFEKDIIAHDSDEVLAALSLQHSLPFVPYPGLAVVDDKNPATDETDYENHEFQAFYTGEISSVCWRYSKFVCQVEPHKMTPDNKLEAVIATHYGYEWELDGLYFEARKALEIHLEELEKELADAPPDETAERKRHELEKIRKKLRR
jgi:hypothetical protein